MSIKAWREFIQLESSSGILMLIAAVLAIFVNNSSLQPTYQKFFNIPLGFHWGEFGLVKSILDWINEGLMTIFFLLVGLEVKREMVEGELNSWQKAILPVIAAVGGMLIPALIYILCTANNPIALKGWAIPTATDIAFALGILTLLGSRLPSSLKVFLTALAIFDDLGAITIIAFFYNKNVSWLMLLFALMLLLILMLLNRLRVTQSIPYFLLGFIIWLCVLESGVHATLAGVLIAFALPMQKMGEESTITVLEHRLHPWVAFGVLPLFAFANAGISFSGMIWHDFLNPVVLGIALGLFLGKQLGIPCASWAAIRLGLAKMPQDATMLGLYGTGMIAGIGFTMSLFIGSLAFPHLSGFPQWVRIGVLTGSLLSGVLGFLVLYFSHPPQRFIT